MEADYPVIIREYYCYLDHCAIRRPVIQPLLIIAESIDISRDKSIQREKERERERGSCPLFEMTFSLIEYHIRCRDEFSFRAKFSRFTGSKVDSKSIGNSGRERGKRAITRAVNFLEYRASIRSGFRAVPPYNPLQGGRENDSPKAIKNAKKIGRDV